MSVPDELRRYVPRTDLYDSLELVHYHMPVEQPPATASYIIFKKGNKYYAKNGTYGHIEYENSEAADLIQDCLNNNGYSLHFKAGVYVINETITIPRLTGVYLTTGVKITGEGAESTVLKLGDNINDHMFEYTDTENAFFSFFANLCFNGNKANNTAGDIFHLNNHMPDAMWLDCFFYNMAGYGIYTENAWNYRIIGCTFESGATDGIWLNGAHDAKIIASKFLYNGGSGAKITDPKRTKILGNFFYMNNKHGLELLYSSGSEDNSIVGNTFANNSQEASNSYDGLYLQTSQSLIIGNIFNGWNRERYGINLVSGHIQNIIIGNRFRDHQSEPIRAVAAFAPYMTIRHNRGCTTENGGTATFSGDGTTTTFTISHGLVDTPNSYRVQPASADAAGDFYVTADSTNLTVTYSTAPPSGTDNIVLVWQAEI